MVGHKRLSRLFSGNLLAVFSLATVSLDFNDVFPRIHPTDAFF